jgi:hypothetical protein
VVEVIERIFHHCTKWEDYKHGMFRESARSGDDAIQSSAAALLGDHFKLKQAMLKVIDNWPIASEENLSNVQQNRQAWLGWAACSLSCNAPDIVTRRAWGTLTLGQQDRANAVADEVILEWEARYERERGQQCLFAS